MYAEPIEVAEDVFFKLLLAALPVGVLEEHEKACAVLFGVEVVEECRPGTPDGERSGRRRRKTGDNFECHTYRSCLSASSRISRATFSAASGLVNARAARAIATRLSVSLMSRSISETSRCGVRLSSSMTSVAPARA